MASSLQVFSQFWNLLVIPLMVVFLFFKSLVRTLTCLSRLFLTSLVAFNCFLRVLVSFSCLFLRKAFSLSDSFNKPCSLDTSLSLFLIISSLSWESFLICSFSFISSNWFWESGLALETFSVLTLLIDKLWEKLELQPGCGSAPNKVLHLLFASVSCFFIFLFLVGFCLFFFFFISCSFPCFT